MKSIIKRDVFDKIKIFLDDDEIIVIHGARQVGKTSLMKYIMEYLDKNVQDMLYIDLEDSAYLQLLNSGVDEFIKYLKARNFTLENKTYIFIDEVQYMDNPTPFLKLLYDTYKGKIKLVLSGSSTFAIKSKFKGSLVGRIIDFELFPLSFTEYIRFKNVNYNFDMDFDDKINNELKMFYIDYCLFGSYPGIVLEPVIEKKEIKLKQIINTYIKSDIRDIGNIRNIQKFNNLLRILSAQTGSMVNFTELSSTIGLAKQTVEEYMFILENTYVLKVLHPFYDNLRSELTKMPKVFLEDNGIMNILKNNMFMQNIDGHLFENSIFSEIRKYFGTEYLFFWRTIRQQEIDFILSKSQTIPIEVKLNIRRKDLSSLKYFIEKYNIPVSYICSLDKPKFNLPDNIKFIYPWKINKLDI